MSKIFISGATRGIGKAIADRILLNNHHTKVAIGGTSSRTVSGVVLDLSEIYPCRVSGCPADFRDLNNVDVVFERVKDFDVFINSAGLYQGISYDILNVNLNFPILLMEKLFRHFWDRGHGTIANINSLACRFPKYGERVYCGSKSGLSGYIQSLQEQPGPIKVFEVCLGATQTDMSKWREDYDQLIRPAEIADVVYDTLFKYQSLRVISQTIKRNIYK